MPGGWIGINGTAHTLRQGWVGIDGTAHKIVAGWVGVDGVAKKIWPRYVRHYHVNSSAYDTERDSDQRDSGYDLTNTVNAEYTTTKGGCYTVPYYQFTGKEYYTVYYEENVENSIPTGNVIEGTGDGQHFTQEELKCQYCGDTGWYVYDGAQIRPRHNCYESPYKTAHTASREATMYGTTVTSDAKNITQIGYAPGCGCIWGQIIEDGDA